MYSNSLNFSQMVVEINAVYSSKNKLVIVKTNLSFAEIITFLLTLNGVASSTQFLFKSAAEAFLFG